MRDLAKFLMLGGVLLFAAGALIYAFGRVPFFGRLPGDIAFERGNVRFYFPLATGIVLSLLLTVVLNLFFRR